MVPPVGIVCHMAWGLEILFDFHNSVLHRAWDPLPEGLIQSTTLVFMLK